MVIHSPPLLLQDCTIQDWNWSRCCWRPLCSLLCFKVHSWQSFLFCSLHQIGQFDVSVLEIVSGGRCNRVLFVFVEQAFDSDADHGVCFTSWFRVMFLNWGSPWFIVLSVCVLIAGGESGMDDVDDDGTQMSAISRENWGWFRESSGYCACWTCGWW